MRVVWTIIAVLAAVSVWWTLLWLLSMGLNLLIGRYRYRFSKDGVDALAYGGRWIAFRIRKPSIRYVSVIGPFDIRRFGPLYVNATTRCFGGPMLLIKTRGIFSYVLSPDDIDGALRKLELSRSCCGTRR